MLAPAATAAACHDAQRYAPSRFLRLWAVPARARTPSLQASCVPPDQQNDEKLLHRFLDSAQGNNSGSRLDLNGLAKCGPGPARGSFWQKKPFARPPRCSHGFDRGKCLNGSSPTLSVLQNPVAHVSEAPAPAWGSQGMHPEAKSGRVGTGGRASGRCLKSSFLAHLAPAARDRKT